MRRDGVSWVAVGSLRFRVDTIEADTSVREARSAPGPDYRRTKFSSLASTNPESVASDGHLRAIQSRKPPTKRDEIKKKKKKKRKKQKREPSRHVLVDDDARPLS